MHQFIEACLAVPNPDLPDRPINSPKWCYQIETKALRLFKSFGTTNWAGHLTEWQATVETLKHRYAREREMNKVPLQLAEGKELYLTPGNHSRLIRAVVEEFAPRFAPGGQVIYVGDTGEISWATEVWVADTESHLIHFNGERFLGTYDAARIDGNTPGKILCSRPARAGGG